MGAGKGGEGQRDSMGPPRQKSLLPGGTDTQRGKGGPTLLYGQGSGVKKGSDAGNRLCPAGSPFL